MERSIGMLNATSVEARNCTGLEALGAGGNAGSVNLKQLSWRQ